MKKFENFSRTNEHEKENLGLEGQIKQTLNKENLAPNVKGKILTALKMLSLAGVTFLLPMETFAEPDKINKTKIETESTGTENMGKENIDRKLKAESISNFYEIAESVVKAIENNDFQKLKEMGFEEISKRLKNKDSFVHVSVATNYDGKFETTDEYCISGNIFIDITNNQGETERHGRLCLIKE